MAFLGASQGYGHPPDAPKHRQSRRLDWLLWPNLSFLGCTPAPACSEALLLRSQLQTGRADASHPSRLRCRGILQGSGAWSWTRLCLVNSKDGKAAGTLCYGAGVRAGLHPFRGVFGLTLGSCHQLHAHPCSLCMETPSLGGPPSIPIIPSPPIGFRVNFASFISPSMSYMAAFCLGDLTVGSGPRELGWDGRWRKGPQGVR